MSPAPLAGVITSVMASHLVVTTEDGQTHWLSYHLQVAHDVSRRVGTPVQLVYRTTAGGCWWQAVPA